MDKKGRACKLETIKNEQGDIISKTIFNENGLEICRKNNHGYTRRTEYHDNGEIRKVINHYKNGIESVTEYDENGREIRYGYVEPLTKVRIEYEKEYDENGLLKDYTNNNGKTFKVEYEDLS